MTEHTEERALDWESGCQLCDFGRLLSSESLFSLCCLRRSLDLIHGFLTVLLSALVFPEMAQGAYCVYVREERCATRA